MKIMDRMIVGLIELFTKIYWRKMHMEYKRNIYLFLISLFLTNNLTYNHTQSNA